MGELESITAATFEAEVIEASRRVPVLVDFWAPWCGPCRALGPILESLAAEYGERLRVVKVDSDEQPELAGRFDVRSIPAVKLFRDGVVVGEFLGARPAGAVRAFLEPHVPRPSAAAHQAALALLGAGDTGAALEALREVVRNDPGNTAAKLDLARVQARSGDLAAARATLDALPPLAQSDPGTLAARAFVHFCGLATAEVAPVRQAAAKLLVAGDAETGLGQLLAAMRADRKAARGELREDLLLAFDLLDDAHPAVLAARRQLAGLLH